MRKAVSAVNAQDRKSVTVSIYIIKKTAQNILSGQDVQTELEAAGEFFRISLIQ